MIVMKFGGTSVADAVAIQRTISIVAGKLKDKPVVVVSACAKVTDTLYRFLGHFEKGEEKEAMDIISSLKVRHKKIIEDFAPNIENGYDPKALESIHSTIDTLCDTVWTLAKAHSKAQIPDSDRAYITSTGEYLSSNVIAFLMNAMGIRTTWVNARDFMVTNSNYLSGLLQAEAVTRKAGPVIAKAYEGADAVITQGFAGVTAEGDPTILGRGGSDYSASFLGMALDVDRIEIWTDVDGIRTADPRIIQGTKGIRKLSYEEAAELARFGAKVLHPLTLEPAASKNIPLYVLNSMNPGGEGTVVLNSSCIFDGIKSISYNENIKVINIYTPKMVNTSGFMYSIFKVFCDHGVSVDMISTAEASVTLTVDAHLDIDGVVKDLAPLGTITVDRDKSQVSIIGKNIIGVKGALANIFGAVSDSKIYMMSQGSSFLNLSLVVDRPEMIDVISKLHKAFFDNGD